MTSDNMREDCEGHLGSAPPRDLSRGGLWTAGATLTYCALCMVALARLRGGWLDEYWTIWLGDPKLNLQAAFWARWMGDTPHPPLYAFLAWILAPFPGEALADKRLINAVALLLIVPTALLCLRRSKGQIQIVLFGIVMCSCPYFLGYFAEHRSYFLALTAMACLTVTVRQCHFENYENAKNRWPVLWWLLITAIFAFNLHYMVAIMASVLLGCAAIYHWLSSRRGLAICFAGIGLAAAVPMLFFASIAFNIHATPVVTTLNMSAGLFNMAIVTAAAVLGNLVVLALAAGGAAQLALRPQAFLENENATAAFIQILLATIVGVWVVFTIVHGVLSVIVPRQFLGSVPIVIALLCELAALRQVRRSTLMLVCTNAILIASVTTVLTIRNHRWEMYAEKIRSVVEACPQTEVLAVNPFSDQPSKILSPGAKEVAELGYQLIGKKYGFEVVLVPQGATVSVSSRSCPTLVWMEHNFVHMNADPKQILALANLNLNGATIQSTDRDEGHLLIYLRPPQH